MEDSVITIQLEAFSFTGGDRKVLKFETCFSDYIDRILVWLSSPGQELIGVLNTDFYLSLFPQEDWSWRSDDQAPVRCSPKVRLITDKSSWVRIWVEGYDPVFAFRDQKFALNVCPVPSCYVIDELGDVAGDRMIFRARDGDPYPWMIIHPGRYDALGRLNYLTGPPDEDAINVLTRFPTRIKNSDARYSKNSKT